MGRKSRLYRSEVNLSKDLFNDSVNNYLEEANLAEIESRICHLKTFSNLSHRRYARMLYSKIKSQLSDSSNHTNKVALNKLAHIIELKISTSI